MVLKCAGLSEQFGASFEIFPYPSNGLFNVAAAVTEGSVEVCDALGKTILRQQVASGTLRLDLGAHSDGMYFVMLYTKGVWITRKIVIGS